MYCVKCKPWVLSRGLGNMPRVPYSRLQETELAFLRSLWGLGTEEEEVYRTGPPDYIGWQHPFLGFDSRAPYTFKNTGSGGGGVMICTVMGELFRLQRCTAPPAQL
jgi:hypothetical protein